MFRDVARQPAPLRDRWQPDERRDSDEETLRAMLWERCRAADDEELELDRWEAVLDERRDNYERQMRLLMRETDERRDTARN